MKSHVSAKQGQAKPIADNGTPDGKAVTYVVQKGAASNVWKQPLQGGLPKQITHFPLDRIRSYAWSRDGKKFAITRGHESFDAVMFTQN